MSEYSVTVEKLTDVSLLRRANSFTTNRDSKMDLATAYRHGHSPIRTQLFWVELRNIPLFVASQIVRAHVGIQCFQLSKRTDRGGENFNEICALAAEHLSSAIIHGDNDAIYKVAGSVREYPKRFCRYAPTDLAFLCNAESLINMAHKRLCTKASQETGDVVREIKCQVSQVDPDLAQHMVPTCVFRNGICPEPNTCSYCMSTTGRALLEDYQRIMKFE